MRIQMPSLLKLVLLSTILTVSGCSDGSQVFSSRPSKASGDVSGKSQGYYKVGTPYQVAGLWYYPKEDYSYKEIGVSSWYGADFHNGITANGELYDMHSLTAAHRTLPLPSVVRVTNLQNGRSLVLRVNDRGPFVNNRIIDVSMRAAQLLGFKDQGTTQVQVELMPEESKALKEELLAGQTTGAKQQIEKSMSETAENLENGTQESRSKPLNVAPQDLSYSGKYPRLANPPPALIDAPLVLEKAEEKTSQYNDWDEDLSKNKAQKEYVAPVTPQVDRKKIANPTPAPKPVAKPLVAPTVVSVVPAGYYVQIGAFGNMDNVSKMVEKTKRFGSVVTHSVEVNGKTLHRVRIGPSNAQKALEVMDKMTSDGFSGMRLVEEKGGRQPSPKSAPALVSAPVPAGQRLDDEF